MFGSKRTDVPQTIDDRTWTRIQKGAAKEIPAFDGPWMTPQARAKVRAWTAAAQKAGQN
jgi:hypothetical protein